MSRLWHCPSKKSKPGSLGESSTVSKKIVGDLDNVMCEDELKQLGKAEWEFKYLSTLKVPERNSNSLFILSIEGKK